MLPDCLSVSLSLLSVLSLKCEAPSNARFQNALDTVTACPSNYCSSVHFKIFVPGPRLHPIFHDCTRYSTTAPDIPRLHPISLHDPHTLNSDVVQECKIMYLVRNIQKYLCISKTNRQTLKAVCVDNHPKTLHILLSCGPMVCQYVRYVQ